MSKRKNTEIDSPSTGDDQAINNQGIDNQDLSPDEYECALALCKLKQKPIKRKHLRRPCMTHQNHVMYGTDIPAEAVRSLLNDIANGSPEHRKNMLLFRFNKDIVRMLQMAAEDHMLHIFHRASHLNHPHNTALPLRVFQRAAALVGKNAQPEIHNIESSEEVQSAI